MKQERFNELAKAFASTQLSRKQVLQGVAASLLVGGSFSALGSKPAGAQDGKSVWAGIHELKGTYNVAYTGDFDYEGGNCNQKDSYSIHATVEVKLVDRLGGSTRRVYEGGGPHSGQCSESVTCSYGDGGSYESTEIASGSDPERDARDDWFGIEVNLEQGTYELYSSDGGITLPSTWNSKEIFEDGTTVTDSGTGQALMPDFPFEEEHKQPLNGTSLSGSVSTSDEFGTYTATWSFTTKELLPEIPNIMSHYRWLNGARFQERWFAGPAKVFGTDFQREILSGPDKGKVPPDAPRDTTTIKMESFVLTFPRAQKVYADLIQGRRWMNKNAKKTIGAMLSRNKKLTNQKEDFGKAGNKPISSAVDLYPDHIQEAIVSWSLKQLQNFDDLFCALGDFTLQLAICGYVEPVLSNKGTHKVTIEKVGVYVADQFDFGGRQFLGFWDDDPPYASADILGPGTAVYNSSYRDWRKAHGKGEDFLVFSDVLWTDVDPVANSIYINR